MAASIGTTEIGTVELAQDCKPRQRRWHTCSRTGFVYGFKSRLRDVVDDDSRYRPGYALTVSDVEDYMHRWHKGEARGLETRLNSVSLLPFFLTPLPPSTPSVTSTAS